MAVINGNAPNQTLTGTIGADTITAFAGNGNDLLQGLGGNDLLIGDGGNDTLDGGTGIDTLVGGTGDDTYQVDVVGDVTNETLDGGGYDTVLIAPTAAGSYILRAGIERGRINVTLAGVHLTGNELDNELIGGSGNNSLSGLAGNDWIEGGAGNDTLVGGLDHDTLSPGPGNDSVLGDDGWDTLWYEDATAPVNVNLTTARATGASIGTDTLAGINMVRGSAFADTLVGSSGADNFAGNDGNDSINGGAGDDSLYLNAGTGGATVDLQAGTSSGPGEGSDTIAGFEHVAGTPYGDTLLGDALDNLLEPRGGSDSLDGRGGNDTLLLWGLPQGVDVNFVTGRATSGPDTHTLAGIEHADGSAFADTMLGDGADNRLMGNDDADSLTGGDGADELFGGSGNDTLIGGNGNDNLQGNEGNDSINAGAGVDFIVGGAGVDSIDGGSDNDVALFEDGAQAVVINLLTGTVSNDGHGNAETITNVENLHGSYQGDSLTLGNGGAYVFGRAGNDTLVGGTGNDNFIPGSGADSVVGGNGSDNVDYYDGDYDGGGAITQGASVNLTTNLAVDGWGFTDTLSGIENVNGTQRADTIVGNSGNNNLNGNDGHDSISGGGGADNLNGGAGNDTLRGETGGDTFNSDAGNDLLDGGLVTDLVNYTDGNTINYANSPAGIVMDLRGYDAAGTGGSGTVQDGFGNTDTLVGIGFVNGSPNNDSIRGSDATWFEMFDGGLGNDTLDGGLNGSNRVRYNLATGPVIVDLLAGTASGGGGNDVLSNFQAAYGSNYDDQIYGSNTTTVTEQFTGNGGNDLIDGRGGIDVVRLEQGGNNAVTANLVTGIATDGQGGTDTLVGIEGVYGGNGNDTLTGGNPASDAFETWRGGAGNDLIDGGSGIDRVEYGSSTSAVNITLANSGDTVVSDGLGGTDTLRNVERLLGSSLADTLTGNDAANTLEGGNGNDMLRGGLGDDSLAGGGNTDWVLYDTASGPVTVNLVANTVSGAAGNDSLSGIERVLGSPFADSITGSSNLVQEMFEGHGGNDTMDGGAITDRSNYSNGNWVSYAGSPAAVSVDLSAIGGDGSTGSGTASDGRGGTDTLRNISWVLGSPQNDSILGTLSTLFEQHEGGAGNDTIDGGNDPIGADELGATRAVYTNAPSAVTVDLVADTAGGGDGSDTLIHVQQATGSAHADSMLGDAGNNAFIGNAGNDTLDGGAGEDWLRFDTATSGVTFALNGTGAEQTVSDGQGGTDTVRNFEHVRGGGSADALTGSGRTDIVEQFMGLAGNDTVNGGAGIDRALYTNSPAAVNITIGATGGGSDGHGNTDTLLSIEQVRGSRFDDTLSGSDGAALENFDGRHGNDTLDGNGGPDQADYFYAWTAGAHVDLASGAATQDGYGGSDTLLDIEHVRGAQDYGDTLLGNSGANSLDGSGGDDSLDGREGNDTLIGGDGHDTLVGGAGTDSLVGGLGNDRYVIDALAEPMVDAGGIDTVAINVATAGSYTLPAGFEHAEVLSAAAVNVSGNTGDNSISGGAGNNSLSGGEGNDTLWAGTGNDTVDGGNGTDLLRLPGNQSAYAATESGTDVRLTSAGGENILLRANVESVQFADGTRAFADLLVLAGGAGNETIDGDDGPNLLDGAGGNDLLRGFGGNDTLIGGAGIDTLQGGPGDDLYRIDVATDVVTELADEGIDSVQVPFAGSYTLTPHVENASATGAAAVATHLLGNDRPNLLTGNAAGNSLTGNAGNDTLDGGLGNDTMAGGPGDDRYVLSAPTDVVNETAAGSDGIDTELLVFTAAGSDTLDGGVEHAVVGNALAVNVTGNALNNALTGGDGANSLVGLTGDDTLVGAGGNDTLAGGPGFDTADYSAAGSGVDVNLATGNASGGAGGDQLSEIEKLIGTAFNDTLTGGPVDETFVPGAGDDLVSGGGAAFLDTVDYSTAAGPLLVNLQTQSASGGGIGNDTLVGINQVIGSAFADSITGSDSGPEDSLEVFVGGAGNDTVVGGSYGLVSRYLQGPVTGNVGLGSATSAGEGTDTLVNVAGLWGSPQADSLTGSDLQDDVLLGDAGNDTLRGGGGDDGSLIPGPGSDLVDGGSGNDFARFFFEPLPVNANLATGIATSGTDTDTLVSIENLGGTDFGDTLVGNDNANWVDAEPGNDLVQGMGGNDSLGGQLGNDTLDGGAGNDRLSGDDGDDSLLGGAGTDEMHGNAGNDTLRGDDDNDSLFGQEGNDSLVGGNGNDQLRGDAGNDTIVGEAGNDYITGGTGNDSIVGGDGIDTSDYFFSDTNGPITVNLGAATPTASGSQGLDTLVGIENINAGDFNDTITGDANANQIEGRGGNDSILGGAGNDVLLGGSGNDTMRGEGGNDFVRGNAGNDSLDGGTVTDRANYTDGNSLSWSDATGAVAVDMRGLTGDGSTGSATAQDGLGGIDTFVNFQFFTLSPQADTFFGSSALQFEQVEPGLGNDTLDGGAQTDPNLERDGNRINYTGAGSAVEVDLEDGTATGGAGTDSFVNFNQVRGSAHNDTLRGSDREDYSESFEGRAGNDSIDGRGGFDIVRYDPATGPVTVNLVSGSASDGQGGTDTLEGIEGVYGGAFNDSLVGGNAASGTDDTDHTVFELFRGGAGNDTIDGGQGFDIADYLSSVVGVVVTLNDTADGSASDGTSTVPGASGTDVLKDIEGARGSPFSDSLVGSDTAALEGFDGRAGNDTIDGNGGIDIVTYRQSPAGVNVNLLLGTASDGFGNTDTLRDIEWVRGSHLGNDTLTGNATANTLEGFEGNDSLAGGDGDDRLDAGTGNDTVDGGTGNDTLVVLGDFADYTRTAPTPTDTVLVNPATGEQILLRNVETVSFADGDVAIADVRAGGGSPGADTLIGDSGDNLLDGLGGNDRIEGRSGNDTLIGGAGNDTLLGEEGDDEYRVDVAADQVIEDPAEGDNDTVLVGFTVASLYPLPANVEHARVTSNVAVGLAGNALDNRLSGNAVGNGLTGGAGNDTLDGGAGNDTLAGGAGNDWYVLNVATDVVNETAAGSDGVDTVELAFTAAGAYTLGANVENARVSGAQAVNVTGNALDNTLEGSAGANSLAGLAGNDRLIGGGGNDTLSGGDGFDAVDYSSAGSGVTVDLPAGTATGAATGSDLLSGFEVVEGSAFSDTLLGDDNDNQLFGGDGDDSLVGNGGSDGLYAGDGQNTLIGGSGNDFLFTGATGNDIVDGGEGFDQAYWDDAPGPVHINLVTNRTTGAAGTDTLVGIEGGRGSDFADTLTGNDLDNEWQGGDGADSIVGAGGIDLVRFTIEPAGVNANLLTQRATTSTGTDTLTGVENLRGTSFPDTLVGDDGPNWIRGGPTGIQANGNDSLVGNGGDDTLAGEGWTDTLVGGEGNDRYEVYGGEPVIEQPNQGTDTLVLVTTHFAAVAGLADNVENGIVSPGTADFVLTLQGNGGSNLLTGSPFGESISGGDGDDTLVGGGGNDTLDGGNHTANSFDFVDYRAAPGPVVVNLVHLGLGSATGEGTDTLSNIEAVFGSAFNDSVTIGAGHPRAFVQPGAGNDTVVGLGSFDILDYGASAGPIVITGGATLAGTATGEGTDTYSGIEGLFGGAHNDTITGSNGNETIRPRGGDDVADGGGGTDRIDYRNASGPVTVSLVTNRSGGADGVDTLSGFENVRGSLNHGDTLTGDAAPNLLDGSGGNDSLVGNEGDDTFVGGSGNDTLVGGAQGFFDTVDYTASAGAVTVNLATGSATGDGTDSLDGIEAVWGSTSGDSITGSNASLNLFWPNLGNDTVNAGDGFDLLAYDNQDLAITVLFSAPGAGTATGMGTDVFTGVEMVLGSRAADSMVGSPADETFRGNQGNDTLDGGAGNDTADYRQATAGVNVDLGSQGSTGADGFDVLLNFESISGSLNFGDTLTGDGNANRIDGRGGNDSLQGNAGNDTLLAGTGQDTVDGGNDSDTLVLTAAFVSYTLSRPNATDIVLVNAATSENVTARNVENLQFSDVTRTLASILLVTPSPFDDTVEGTGGNDSIDALAGNDSVSGFGGNDTLLGGPGNDTLLGGPGNDDLRGGAGVDSLVGGDGDDGYLLELLTDVVVEAANEGLDTVNLADVTTPGVYTVPAGIERAFGPSAAVALQIVGNDADNQLRSFAGAQTLVGGIGNDSLDGGAGVDVARGGAGDDLYTVDQVTDQLDETSAGSSGTDAVHVGLTAAGMFTLPAGVERAFVVSAAGVAVNLTGNALANILTGHDGPNSIAGGDGDDTLTGNGSAQDTLDGGVGNDTLFLPGVRGDYVLTRPDAATTLFVGGPAGQPQNVLVRNVELVLFTVQPAVPLADLIATIGSPGNDTLTSDASDHTLDGGAGNDTLIGGGGTDILDGGAGSDQYGIVAGNELDVIEQNDTVAASVDIIALPAGVLPADVRITRGHYSFNDLVITLPDGGQVVVVDFYNGEIISTGTIDQLRFASGAVFTQAQLAAAGNSFIGGETVFVGTVGNDTMSGDKLGSAADWISAGSGNDNVAGLTGNDTLFGGAGTDGVTGGLGVDWLSGGDGNDTLDGGPGDDIVAGGAGSDRYVFALGSGEEVIDESMSRAEWADAQVSGVGPAYTRTDGDLPRSVDTDVVALGAGITTANLLTWRDGDDLQMRVDGTNDFLTVLGYFAPGVPTIERFLFANGSSWTATTVRTRVLVPTEDADTITGYLGGDNLRGLGGDDQLDGREGNDTLTGGEGADQLTGGSGSDRFVLTDGVAPIAVDLIHDFTPGVDRLVLSKAAFSAFSALATGTLLDPDLNANIGYDPNTGALTYDADGEGVGAAGVIVAVLGVSTHPAELGLDIQLGS